MNIFIGYDSREDLAYQVCAYSINKHQPLATIRPLKLNQLQNSGVYWRDPDQLSSTEFSFSRFLVPYLTAYKGWAIFCDCDFLFLDDVNKIFQQADNQYAVMCVQQEHRPQTLIKMDGKAQYLYPRKNWSSLILWNCQHPSNQQLTPAMVNTQSGLYLHQFDWLNNHEIGKLDPEWNCLVGWTKENNPKALHYTEGGPWFEQYRQCEYNQIWKDYLNEMLCK
jgi:lipopolysaccharide biosynthesis glycosyltransferase